MIHFAKIETTGGETIYVNPLHVVQVLDRSDSSGTENTVIHLVEGTKVREIVTPETISDVIENLRGIWAPD